MNDHDPLDALRAARRVSDAEIAGSVDRQALRALREGITMISPDQPATLEPPRRGRRLGRRGVSAGALALVLVGGGAAVAAYQQWYVGGGADGLTCMTTWQNPSDSNGPLDSTGGPALTGDPVADCQRYQQLSGRPEINDPVAFTRNGYLYVAPRDQVPSDGTPLAARPAGTEAAMRLDASLQDWVDGGNSRCFTTKTAVPYMKAEIARLGLKGWSTKVMPDNRPNEDGPCGGFDTDPVSRTVMFLPARGPDPNVRRPNQDVSGFVYDVRDALRTGITARCVSTQQAQDVVAKALGAQHHWPTTVVRTDSPCASVDLVVGGSLQVWIYGPEVARP